MREKNFSHSQLLLLYLVGITLMTALAIGLSSVNSTGVAPIGRVHPR